MSPRSKYVPENETQLSTENDMSKRLDKAEDDQIKHDMQREFTADDFTPVEFLSQCLALAEEREYRDKWNEYTFAEKFDRKPTEEEITQALNMGMEISVEFMDWLHRYWRESKKQQREEVVKQLPVERVAIDILERMGREYAVSLGHALIGTGSQLYLVKKNGNGVVHLWDGEDTVCRICSTGGLKNRGRYKVVDNHAGRKICQNCRSKQEE